MEIWTQKAAAKAKRTLEAANFRLCYRLFCVAAAGGVGGVICARSDHQAAKARSTGANGGYHLVMQRQSIRLSCSRTQLSK